MEAGKEVKLLGNWGSPYAIRAAIALELKGVAYESLEEVFGSNGKLQKSKLLLDSNPVHKKIPVLIHGGKPVCESMIIVQYIDEVWSGTGPSILPSDPHDRAVARFWSAYVDEWTPKPFLMLRATTVEAKAEAAKQAIAGLSVLEEAYKKCSKGKSFFGGDTVGYVDIALGCSLGWVRAAEELSGIKLLDEAVTPQLVQWAERFWAVDAVRKVVAGVDKFVEVGKLIQALANARPN